MARRTLDRKRLREEATAAKAAGVPDKPVRKKTTKLVDPDKPGSALKVKKARTRKVKLPPRTRVRWCIYDGGMKQVAVFDYNQLNAAKTKLAELLEKKPNYFLQLFKDLLPVEEEVAVV
jgi:hypothetical protein